MQTSMPRSVLIFASRRSLGKIPITPRISASSANSTGIGPSIDCKFPELTAKMDMVNPWFGELSCVTGLALGEEMYS